MSAYRMAVACAVLSMAAVMATLLVAIWTGDGRWAGTSLVLLVPFVGGCLVASALEDGR